MSTIIADVSRGFDVFKGAKLLASFGSYAEAWAFASQAPGRWVRYWAL